MKLYIVVKLHILSSQEEQLTTRTHKREKDNVIKNQALEERLSSQQDKSLEVENLKNQVIKEDIEPERVPITLVAEQLVWTIHKEDPTRNNGER